MTTPTLTKEMIEYGKQKFEELIMTLPRGERNHILLDENYSNPQIIGSGETATVFDLGSLEEFQTGVVAKIGYIGWDFERKIKYLIGNYSSGEYDGLDSEKNISALRQMGFDNVLDHEKISRISYNQDEKTYTSPNVKKCPSRLTSTCGTLEPYAYYLCPDLRENGKYETHSIEKFPFNKVSNGLELLLQAKQSLDLIKTEIASEKYDLEVDHHGTKDKPDEALIKMFIGRINKQTNEGELIFADLNHLIIHPSSQRYKEKVVCSEGKWMTKEEFYKTNKKY